MQRKARQWRRKIERIRHPALRIIIGVALLAGGVLWFLPILGIWMVPLGIAVLAIDIPWMRPVNQFMRRWIAAGIDAMQRSSIGWVSTLGLKLGSPVTLRRGGRKLTDGPHSTDKARLPDPSSSSEDEFESRPADDPKNRT